MRSTKPRSNSARIDARSAHALIEPALGARGVLRRRQPDECEVVAALEMDAGLLERSCRSRSTSAEAESGNGCADRAAPDVALRLDEDRPAGAETASALLSRAVVPTSSAGVALSRSGPRKRAVL